MLIAKKEVKIDSKKEIMSLLDIYERISILDIPSRLIEEVNSLISKKVLVKKLYCYDIEYKEHLSTYYIQKV